MDYKRHINKKNMLYTPQSSTNTKLRKGIRATLILLFFIFHTLICKIHTLICNIYSLICKIYTLICKIHTLICKIYTLICKIYTLICKMYSLFDNLQKHGAIPTEKRRSRRHLKSSEIRRYSI